MLQEECDCQFCVLCISYGETHIYEENSKKDAKTVDWYRLMQGDIVCVPLWMVMKKQPMGYQYMNTHNKYIYCVFC